jgi:hypothetical protein
VEARGLICPRQEGRYAAARSKNRERRLEGCTQAPRVPLRAVVQAGDGQPRTARVRRGRRRARTEAAATGRAESAARTQPRTARSRRSSHARCLPEATNPATATERTIQHQRHSPASKPDDARPRRAQTRSAGPAAATTCCRHQKQPRCHRDRRAALRRGRPYGQQTIRPPSPGARAPSCQRRHLAHRRAGMLGRDSQPASQAERTLR